MKNQKIFALLNKGNKIQESTTPGNNVPVKHLPKGEGQNVYTGTDYLPSSTILLLLSLIAFAVLTIAEHSIKIISLFKGRL